MRFQGVATRGQPYRATASISKLARLPVSGRSALTFHMKTSINWQRTKRQKTRASAGLRPAAAALLSSAAHMRRSISSFTSAFSWLRSSHRSACCTTLCPSTKLERLIAAMSGDAQQKYSPDKKFEPAIADVAGLAYGLLLCAQKTTVSAPHRKWSAAAAAAGQRRRQQLPSEAPGNDIEEALKRGRLPVAA